MYSKYVNVFQGNGEITPSPQGIAAKWFFIKAGTGNTSPAATLPYGRISASPYSGGYPTGYGDHFPNSHSHPAHFAEGKKLLGFTHIQQSGTGAIGFYYNFILVSPGYTDVIERKTVTQEVASPGYYSCFTDDTKCELTVNEKLAIHRYTFAKSGGKLIIDFANVGLNMPSQALSALDSMNVRKTDEYTAVSTFVSEGVTMYGAVRCSEEITVLPDGKAVAALKNDVKNVSLLVSISLLSEEAAIASLSDGERNFEKAKTAALNKWENYLSKIGIDDDDAERCEIFYSNLYHSLIKPADFDGESFFYDKGKPFMLDFATLWDMYKSALPLIFLIDKEASEKICETLMSTCEALGTIPNSLSLNAKFDTESGQARMLGCYTLLAAYRFGIPLDVKRMLNCIKTDLTAPDKYDFTKKHKVKSMSWLLDMSECCALAAELANEVKMKRCYNAFIKYADLWKTAFSEETGLLREDSDYYEGTLYNYSFRPLVAMDERMELAGGKDGYIKLLDRFFGYGAPDVTLPTNPFDYEPVKAGMKLGRFEGLNNESDTEAPFSYIFAGRHDRTCEIIRAGLAYMYGTGRGGIPGNNDSGALSAYYVWNSLGIHPLTGFDFVLVTSPTVNNAKVKLSSGNMLEIEAVNNSNENIYVKSVTFNDEEITDFKIPLKKLMAGGKIKFLMTDTINE